MFKLKTKSDLANTAAIEWLAHLQSPDLSDAQEEAFFAWLDESPLHQAAYVKSEALWEKGEILEKVTPRDEQKISTSIASWFAFDFPSMPAVAASVLVLFCGLGLFQYFQPASETGTYRTALGQQQEIILSDGSKLLLNTNTRIEVDFRRDQRVVRLTQGEVFFDIEKSQGRPFDVVTSSGTVRVLGTQFTVFDTQEKTIVTVVEGRVGLSAAHAVNDKFSADITLTENQQLSIEEAAEGMQAQQVNASIETAWRKQKLIYHGARLKDVIRDINRYYDSQLVLGNPELAEKEVVAVLQLGDFSTTLTSLKISLDLRSSVDENLEFITLDSN